MTERQFVRFSHSATPRAHASRRGAQDEGFSKAMIDRFFRPLLGGIFFNRELTVTSRLFTFVMRMLATGSNCLPAGGIGAMAQQIADGLPAGTVRLKTVVTGVSQARDGQPAAVSTESGTVQAALGVVIAAAGPEARGLLETAGIGGDALGAKAAAGVGTCCVYFRCKASDAPPHGNVLYLDGDGQGIVNNACVPSAVAPEYAPDGMALISASTIGTHDELSEEELVQVRCRLIHGQCMTAALQCVQLLARLQAMLKVSILAALRRCSLPHVSAGRQSRLGAVVWQASS
jgi:phytoene dehydrogenase-like protein